MSFQNNPLPGLVQLSPNLYMQISAGAFTTTGTQLTVRTNLTVIKAAFATPIGAVVTANDVLSVTNSVSSGDVTVTRPASGTSALTVNVVLIG